MTNLIQKNLQWLKFYHYVLKANDKQFWTHINVNVLNKYLSTRGENFYIIIYQESEYPLDFISIPYSILKTKLKQEYLYREVNSWKFSINNGEIRIHRDGAKDRLLVSEFYGNTAGFNHLK
jgi:hypothetical protein